MVRLTVGALGIVYGDIGTSPLYTIKEVFAPQTGVMLTPEHILGVVSVIFWSLMLVVTLKYVILVLRADNQGEGGILALSSLAAQARSAQPKLRNGLLLLGVVGATLFYGDGLITPAISVLGAIEGLEIVAPQLDAVVVPVALAVLIGLFIVQRHGTGAVGRAFGPIMVVWFACLAIAGLVHIVNQPSILAAFNPLYAVEFLVDRGWGVFVLLGAVVLALTGAEALYADLGHFGRRPIQVAWIGCVLPALALNYMGQGALLLADAAAIENPFFMMFPATLTIPVVMLATLAAIIASQAVISGAFSMTRQAIQLGFLPRLTVRYTSAQDTGQIYIPAVNWALLIGVFVVVIMFRSTAALAGAYGVAVTLTMMITTVLTWFVVRDGWKLPIPLVLVATAVFLSVDLSFIVGCLLKFFDGGWFPIVVGAVLFLAMSSWSYGRTQVLERERRDGVELEQFLGAPDLVGVQRAVRTAVYLASDENTVPRALLHNLKHNQVLHECNVIVHVKFENVPWVGMANRASVQPLGRDFWRVTLRYGFMNVADVPRAMSLCLAPGLDLNPVCTSFFLSRARIEVRAGSGMRRWRSRLFATMSRGAGSTAEYFHLPDNAVVEFGRRFEI